MESLKPQGEYFDYIDIDAIDNKSHKISAVKHLLVKEAPSRASRRLENGSVLFSFVRPYLENIAFVDENFSHCIASTGFYICNSNGIINPNFMFVLMTSKYVIDGLNSFMKGDNSPSIKKEEIENFLYPIPPISEQQRIIDRINSVFPIIENLAVQKNNLQKESISIKSKILDLAIRGKLVPQDPNDEPASVLLERIREEKEELIKQGKIKRDKKDSVIFKGDDNSYYQDLPDNWVNIKLSTISEVITKGTTPRGGKVAYADNGIGFLRAENIAGYDKLDLNNLNYVDEKSHNNFLKRSILKANDILITNDLIDRMESVLFVGMADVVNRMQGNFGADRDRYIKSLMRPDLLILDDLGAERNTSFGKERVFDVVDKRLLTGKPMIVTTNIPLSVMKQAADLDDRRIFDRILEVCVPIRFDGENFRKGNASANIKKAAEMLNG